MAQKSAERSKPSAADAGAAANRKVAIVYRPIGELKLDPNNPRLHSKKQIHQIARSIATFGFNVPVLVDSRNQVVAGHGRILACKELGWTEVPTIALQHLTEAQAKAFMIADNRLTEIATWDERLLGESLKALSEGGLDFSLEITGFEMAEIDLRIEGLSSQGDVKNDPVDELPADSGPQVAVPGDLFILGHHRVLCGDALDEANYVSVMNGKRAAAVICDLPYNLAAREIGGLGATRHKNFAMASGEMSKAQFTDFLTRACTQFARHSRDGALQYLFMDWRHLPELLAAGGKVYSEFKNLCVWVKTNAGLGSFYRSQHELILVFKHGTQPARNNVQLGRYGRYRSNVWIHEGMNTFSRSTGDGVSLGDHPTIKPTQLIVDMILDSTARGDIVLDGFLGSGTAVIAAERTGRVCHGIELDPAYVDLTVRRFQKFTGDRARHAVSGKLFDELEAKASRRHAKKA